MRGQFNPEKLTCLISAAYSVFGSWRPVASRGNGAGHKHEGVLVRVYATSVLVMGSDGRFQGRITGAQAQVITNSGVAGPLGSKGKVKVIQFYETLIDERNLESLHMDSRRLTYRQNIEGHEVIALKRYCPRTGAFFQDGTL